MISRDGALATHQCTSAVPPTNDFPRLIWSVATHQCTSVGCTPSVLRAIFRVLCACCVLSVSPVCCVFCALAECAVRSRYLMCAVCVWCALCAVCGSCFYHHSVTQTHTCSSFVSHRNSVHGFVYDTIPSRFRPFSYWVGLTLTQEGYITGGHSQ